MNGEFFPDDQINPAVLEAKRVGVVGYGNQGRAHCLNLRDLGVEVTVGQRPGAGFDQAIADGFSPVTIREATETSDLLMLTLPDEHMPSIYESEIATELNAGSCLLFCHGFAVHFGFLVPPSDVDVALVAPKGAGAKLRSEFEAGRGLMGLVGVHQDRSGQAQELALAYGWGIGCARVGLMETSFKEECETDLFGEQTVLCGGIPELIKAGYETLVEAGYSPQAAYLETLHEAKLITDLLYAEGLAGMRARISDTAEWGGYQTGESLVDEGVKERMKATLDRIQSGEFAKGWMAETSSGKKRLLESRQNEADSEIETVGSEIRKRL